MNKTSEENPCAPQKRPTEPSAGASFGDPPRKSFSEEGPAGSLPPVSCRAPLGFVCLFSLDYILGKKRHHDGKSHRLMLQ